MAVCAHWPSTGVSHSQSDTKAFCNVFAVHYQTHWGFCSSAQISWIPPVWSLNVDVSSAISRVLSQCAASATTEQVALSVCRQTSSSHSSCANIPMGKYFANFAEGKAFLFSRNPFFIHNIQLKKGPWLKIVLRILKTANLQGLICLDRAQCDIIIYIYILSISKNQLEPHFPFYLDIFMLVSK